MSMHCNACRNLLDQTIYESPENQSITTMNTLVDGRTYIYFCKACGHLQTSELPDLAEYYAVEYAINANSEEDDHIYRVVDGKTIFRADHQASVLQSKLEFPEGCKVLDYGCAKAPTLRKLVAAHPGIEPYLFDVTDRYVDFWRRFPKPPHTAVNVLPNGWEGQMDVVLSFYALEHVSDLDGAIGNVWKLLKQGGTFYFLVPNVYQNTADFIVADHINHFSEPSIRAMLERNGFDRIQVDSIAHESAFVVTAAKAAVASGAFSPSSTSSLETLRQQAMSMSSYWENIVGRIRDFEAALPKEATVAIYGAGFYANFIALSMRDVSRVRAFIDQNPHLHGGHLFGQPVLAPAELPPAISHVMVGLNPRIARASIESIPSWKQRSLEFLYL